MIAKLLDAPLGVHLSVVGVPAEAAEALARHGLLAGREIVVEQDAPFGGPRLVRIGGRRIAVPRALARSVEVSRIDGGQRPRT